MASGSQFLYKGSDEIYNQDCDVCLSNGKTSEAISYCNKCCEYLCQSCDMAHRGSRASKHHTILTGSNIPSVSMRKLPTLPFMFCDTHRTSLLDTYCSTHDEVMCPACQLTNHATCNTSTVCKHSAKIDVVKELKKVANRLRDLTIRYDDYAKNRHTDKSTVMSRIQNCFSDMQDFRKDINDQLDKLEKKMSSEIQQIEEKLKKEIDGHVTLADDILHQIRDLDKSLSECEKRRENDVMFVGSMKASSRASEYGLIIGKFEKEIYPIDIRFQPNGVLSDMLQQLQSLGTVGNNQPIDSGPNQTSILNISVKEKRAKDVLSNTVLGCTFMSDGYLVLACGNDGLKMIDENFRLKTLLPFVPSLEVSTINDTDVIVTQDKRKQLQLVRIFPKLKVKKILKMERDCYGVDVYGDEIYVTCHDRAGNDEVRVLNMDGIVQRRLGVDNGRYIFTTPRRIKVNKGGSKVFVTDLDTHTVTCLNKHGLVIYRYTDRDLKSPDGMYVDEEDNLLVCGLNSHNVHIFRDDGRQEKILLSEKDGIHWPVCISYRPSDGCLAVGLNRQAKTDQMLIIFSTR